MIPKDLCQSTPDGTGVGTPSVGTPERMGDELAQFGNPGIGAASTTVTNAECVKGKPSAGMEESREMVCGTRLTQIILVWNS